MKRHAVTLALLLGAIACYVTGMMVPAVALLLAGGVLELAVWIRVLRRH